MYNRKMLFKSKNNEIRKLVGNFWIQNIKYLRVGRKEQEDVRLVCKEINNKTNKKENIKQ